MAIEADETFMIASVPKNERKDPYPCPTEAVTPYPIHTYKASGFNSAPHFTFDTFATARIMSTTTYSLPNRPTIVQTSEFKSNIGALEKPVSYIAVAGTENPDGKFFHFRLSMVQDMKRVTSFRLDMRPSYTDMAHPMRGVLLVEHKEYGTSNSPGTDDFEIKVRPGTTPAMLFETLFNENHFDKYDLSEDGAGCRHWCARVLEKFGEKGFVDAKVGDLFKQYEQAEAQKWGTMVIMPRAEGQFYN